jgi:hypothetical protein
MRKVGYSNLISLESYYGVIRGGMAFKCKWSKPSQRILVVVIDQPQECRFFLPFMFFINVVLISFEFF